MNKGKAPKLPIQLNWIATGKDSEAYIIEICVEQTTNTDKYPPDAIKAVFRVFALDTNGEKVLVLLIDNHEPFGFHEHDRLPQQHDSRQRIHADDWKRAWIIFEERLKEMLR